MKAYKRVISIVLSIALVMSLYVVQSPTKTYAGVKIIVGKKLDLTIGSTDTILVKGKAKAKSSSSKVAKITKKKKSGKHTAIHVKGKKTGKATIKVKVGRKSKKVKVTVRPKKVSSFSAYVSGNNTANLKWKKSKGAKGYYVYRSSKSTSGFKKIATVKKTTYKNSGLAQGKYYYYKVIAYGNKKVKAEKYSHVRYVKTWKLVWQDEFSGNALDLKKWNNNGATGAGGYGNKELQNYQMEYSEVKDGNYTIKPQFNHVTKTVKDLTTGKESTSVYNDSYYSTKVWTNGKGFKQFTYGKFEFRAKMPKGKGTWAAGWMLGNYSNYGKWPACGEIDVFETTSEESKTWIPQSLHMAKFNGMAGNSPNKHWDTTVSTATTAYHVYTVEWYPTYIRFRIDGKETGVYDPCVFTDCPDSTEESHQLIDPTKRIKNDGTSDYRIWPYNKPFYLIMNCAIGGTLGGSVSSKYWTQINDQTTVEEGVDEKTGHPIKTTTRTQTYQDKLFFDYVRVYQ